MVDQQSGQRQAVKLNVVRTVFAAADQNIGYHCCGGFNRIAGGRFGVEALDVVQHGSEIIIVNLGKALDFCIGAGGDQIEMFEQAGDGGIVAVAVAQLDSQRFGKIAGKNTRWFKAL